MRPLLLLATLLFWAYMASTTCTWCNMVCKTGGGLSIHSKSCKQRAIGLKKMGEASRKRHEQEVDVRMVELEELRAKRVRIEEKEKNWMERIFSDKVSRFTLYFCPWQTLWCVIHTEVLVYVWDMLKVVVADPIYHSLAPACVKGPQPHKCLPPGLHTFPCRPHLPHLHPHRLNLRSSCCHLRGLAGHVRYPNALWTWYPAPCLENWSSRKLRL